MTPAASGPSRSAPGWRRFAAEPATLNWVAAALPAAQDALSDPALAGQYQCEDTWFVGLDALPNDAWGRVLTPGRTGPALEGQAWQAAQALAAAPLPLHRAQLSTTFPGYPRPRAKESDVAFSYRLRRDAAHVDGLTPEGPDRRRMLTEPHAYILGIALNQADPGAAPLVVWENSHHIIGPALAQALQGVADADLARCDVTEAYHAARRQVFETCTRRAVPCAPGEAVLVHRHLLHGVAPWSPGATAQGGGRIMAYFRPELPGGAADWLRPDTRPAETGPAASFW